MSQSVMAFEKYYFDASERKVYFQSIDFCFCKLKAITNMTRGVIIFMPETNVNGTFDEATQALTLNYDTTSHADTDILRVIYDWEGNYHKCFDESFGLAVSGGIDTRQMTLICKGAGQTVNQASGALTIAMGTSVNEETIIRSNTPFSRDFLSTVIESRTQNHANQRVSYGFYDIIGTGLTCTSSSATVATVLIPNTNAYYAKFKQMIDISSTALVGMRMFIGALNPVANSIPERYVISSATYDVNNITIVFTVSGWGTSYSGTCALYGWNFIELYHDGSTVANMYFDSGRNGYSSNLGFVTVATGQAASTTVYGFNLQKMSQEIVFSDNAVTSSAGSTVRATRQTGIPSEDTKMYFMIRCRNSTSAPTATTVTVQGLRVEESNPAAVTIGAVKRPSSVPSAYSLPVTGAVTVSSGTVTTVTTLTNATGYTGASTSLPATTHHLISANTTNATSVKGSAGNVLGGIVCNNGENVAYFKLYNKATAPTVGTDTPIATILIPIKGITHLGNIVPLGFRMSTGIAYAITNGMAVSDTTAVAATQVSVHLNYA